MGVIMSFKLGRDYQLKGEMLKIFTFPDPILSQVAAPVTVFNQELSEICQNMLFTMYHAPGIGLAAPQVGISQRIFVIDVDYEREKVIHADESETFNLSDFNPYVFINPTIELIGGRVVFEEGCLSVPGIYEDVERTESVLVKYQDLTGKPQELEVEGLFSICIQHENDHLNGLVFLDRLGNTKRTLLKNKLIKQKRLKARIK